MSCRWWTGCSMTDETDAAPTMAEQVPVPTTRTVPAVRREGAVAIGAVAVGALAVGALAIGAVAIGKLAIGQLSLGRARLHRGWVDDLHIARLTVAERRIERVSGHR